MFVVEFRPAHRGHVDLVPSEADIVARGAHLVLGVGTCVLHEGGGGGTHVGGLVVAQVEVVALYLGGSGLWGKGLGRLVGLEVGGGLGLYWALVGS